jgi:hypothetical protein
VRSALKRETLLTDADFTSIFSSFEARFGRCRGSMLRIRYMLLMTLGEVFLESMSTGVITEQEIAWVASQQCSFARHEEALAIRLGRLLDEGQINLGCRIPS